MDGLLGNINLAALGIDPELLKLLQGAQPDNKAALNQGLMAAGLGMLANATKGAAGGIGAGGLLGLEAYNAERQRQIKDPVAQINLLNSLVGLQDAAQRQKLMGGIRSALGGGQQPAAPMPAPGEMGPPADLAPNFMGPPAGLLGPMSGAPAPTPAAQGGTGQLFNALAPALMDPKMGPQVKNLMDMLGMSGANVRPGGTQTVFNPATGKLEAGFTAPPMNFERLPDGSVRLIPGVPGGTQTQAAAQSSGSTIGTLPFTTTYLKAGDPNQPDVLATKAQELALAQQRGQQALQAVAQGQPQRAAAAPDTAVPPAIAQAYADYVKSGSKQPFSLTYTPPPATPIAPLDLSRTGLPNPSNQAANQAQQIAEQAGPVQARNAALQAQLTQQATLPAQIGAQASEKLNATDMEEFAKAREAAKAASASNDQLNEVRAAMARPGGIFGGKLAPTLQEGLAVLNGMGLEVDATKFQNTQQVQTYLEGLSLKQVKAMVGSTQISDRDVAAVAKMMPQIWKDPAVIPKLVDTLARANDTQISLFERMNAHLAANPTNPNLRGFDYGFRKSSSPNPQIPAPEADASRLPQNMTATAKAQAAIKAGADPAAVRERMIRNGYNPSGL